MRILIWMNRYTIKNRLQNDYIWNKIRAAPIEEKMIEIRLRWFEHVQRRPPEAPVKKKVNKMVFSPIMKDRRKPKRTSGDVIKKDL